MKKAEFVELMKEAGSFDSRKDAEFALDGFVRAVQKALSTHESVELVGFGKFEVALQKGKSGKVPGSDKTYMTKDKMVPKFKPGKVLKDIVSSEKSSKGTKSSKKK
ncbi:HU family DNA-binding protein [Helicobacter suis]|uniref:Dna-binding protein hu n=3 Tax=Helicobacter suis TaxID=104628 RepID=E7G4V3_9HELI|nr:HU family DNA-binding protein [Helicobacter suis]EFX41570.1 dna-binding protein hu [Helicobacter suis HS5]EFX42996.1 DNA-binding protein hu [Helicobacter suis HS1]BCD46298.1 DNA-binding protein Hup [Helicobacter suis]BCD47788.1 DNA-binding protein Hup [Helicobacter suis]BCD49546.1 DNA-binding protein Hup [Helicobacter suis]